MIESSLVNLFAYLKYVWYVRDCGHILHGSQHALHTKITYVYIYTYAHAHWGVPSPTTSMCLTQSSPETSLKVLSALVDPSSNGHGPSSALLARRSVKETTVTRSTRHEIPRWISTKHGSRWKKCHLYSICNCSTKASQAYQLIPKHYPSERCEMKFLSDCYDKKKQLFFEWNEIYALKLAACPAVCIDAVCIGAAVWFYVRSGKKYVKQKGPGEAIAWKLIEFVFFQQWFMRDVMMYLWFIRHQWWWDMMSSRICVRIDWVCIFHLYI